MRNGTEDEIVVQLRKVGCRGAHLDGESEIIRGPHTERIRSESPHVDLLGVANTVKKTGHRRRSARVHCSPPGIYKVVRGDRPAVTPSSGQAPNGSAAH